MTDLAHQSPPRANGIRCPHCGSRARIRSSRSLSPLYREQTYQCLNIECGHIYVAGIEVLRTVSPSAQPNPSIDIPLAAHLRGSAG